MSTLSQKGVAVKKSFKISFYSVFSPYWPFFLETPKCFNISSISKLYFGHLKNETHGEMTRYPRDVIHLHNISYNIFRIRMFKVNFNTIFLNFFKLSHRKCPRRNSIFSYYMSLELLKILMKNGHFYYKNTKNHQFFELLISLSVYFKKFEVWVSNGSGDRF